MSDCVGELSLNPSPIADNRLDCPIDPYHELCNNIGHNELSTPQIKICISVFRNPVRMSPSNAAHNQLTDHTTIRMPQTIAYSPFAPLPAGHTPPPDQSP